MNKLMYIKLQQGCGQEKRCYTCKHIYDTDDAELHTDGKCTCAAPNCEEQSQSILITGHNDDQKKHRLHPNQTWDKTLCSSCNLKVKCECTRYGPDGLLYPVNKIVFRCEPNADGSDHIQRNLHIEHQVNCTMCGRTDTEDCRHCCSSCDFNDCR